MRTTRTPRYATFLSPLSLLLPTMQGEKCYYQNAMIGGYAFKVSKRPKKHICSKRRGHCKKQEGREKNKTRKNKKLPPHASRARMLIPVRILHLYASSLSTIMLSPYWLIVSSPKPWACLLLRPLRPATRFISISLRRPCILRCSSSNSSSSWPWSSILTSCSSSKGPPMCRPGPLSLSLARSARLSMSVAMGSCGDTARASWKTTTASKLRPSSRSTMPLAVNTAASLMP